MSFLANITNIDTDPIPIECNPEYDPVIESVKFAIQEVYLLIGLVLNLAILSTIWIRYREIYCKNSFFILFSMDCLVNSLLLLEGVCSRFLIYFPFVCTHLKDYFASPLLICKLIMIASHHFRICKSLLQTLLVINRMTCVLLPVTHTSTWRRSLPFIVPTVILLPLSVDWNLAISRVYVQSTYGGLYMNYVKKVKWASQSRFQVLFLIIALAFTFICTTITMITLIRLPERIKELEKSITYATIIISAGFTSTVLFQIYYAFFYTFTNASSPVFGFCFLTYDFLFVGSPIVMLCVSSSLRKHTFSLKKEQEDKFFTVRTRSTS